MKKQPYRIEYTPESRDQMQNLVARDRVRVVTNVLSKLSYEPQIETRNRKLLRANDVAPYELRLGALRVYYEVKADHVVVKAVGVKGRDVVRIGGLEVKL